MSHVVATIYYNVYRMDFSVKNNNNNNKNNNNEDKLTDTRDTIIFCNVLTPLPKSSSGIMTLFKNDCWVMQI